MKRVEVLLAAAIGLLIGLSYAPLVKWLRRRTELEAVENAIPPSVEPQLATALDALTNIGGVVLGPHDEMFYANPQSRAFGIVRGSRIANDLLLEQIRECRETREPANTSIRVRQEIGMPMLDLQASLTPLSQGMILVLADDASLQQRTDDIKRDFVANVSHELKTPVGAIRVLAEAVQQAADDPEAVERFSGRMLAETDRLSALVAQIIELSRLQSRDPLFAPRTVDLEKVLALATDHCRELADSRRVTMTISGQPGLQVLGDQEQLVSALENLITNAINYSDERARVAVTMRRVVVEEEPTVEIRVADNGIGIKPEDQQRVFERFYRVDYARSRSSGGSGLGLSIVKHIVGAHRGTISLWSQPGQGSTFTILLPSLAIATSTPTRKETDDSHPDH